MNTRGVGKNVERERRFADEENEKMTKAPRLFCRVFALVMLVVSVHGDVKH